MNAAVFHAVAPRQIFNRSVIAGSKDFINLMGNWVLLAMITCGKIALKPKSVDTDAKSVIRDLWVLKDARIYKHSLCNFLHTVGRHRLGPEYVQISTPQTWPHPNTMRASGGTKSKACLTNCCLVGATPYSTFWDRELWVACSATQELPTRPSYAPKTLEQKRKSVGTKKAVLECQGHLCWGKKSLRWTRKSHIGTLLPRDVSLHDCRHIEIDA